jgi:hypothetical protein
MVEDGCSTAQDQIPGTGSSRLDVHLCSGGLQSGSNAKSDGADCLRTGWQAAGAFWRIRRPLRECISAMRLPLNSLPELPAHLRNLAFQQPARGLV